MKPRRWWLDSLALVAGVLLGPAVPHAAATVRIVPSIGTGLQKGALVFTGGVQLALGEYFELGGEVGYTPTSLAENADVRVLTVLMPVRFHAYRSEAGSLYLQGLGGYTNFDVQGFSVDGLGFGGGVGLLGVAVDGWLRGGIQLDVIAHDTEVVLDDSSVLIRLLAFFGIAVPVT